MPTSLTVERGDLGRAIVRDDGPGIVVVRASTARPVHKRDGSSDVRVVDGDLAGREPRTCRAGERSHHRRRL